MKRIQKKSRILNEDNQNENNKLSPEELKELLAKRVPKKKIRCRNWPNCKDITCKYIHPTERVSLFF